MRLAALCTAALALQPSSRQLSRRAASHRSKAEADDVDADFRRLLATGLTPTDAFTPADAARHDSYCSGDGVSPIQHAGIRPKPRQVKLRDAFRTNPPTHWLYHTQAPAGVQRRGSTFGRPARPKAAPPRRIHSRP